MILQHCPKKIITKCFKELNLESNKKKMFNILQQSPKVGVYLGQNESHWNDFFAMHKNSMNIQLGPRGDCSRLVKAQFAKNPKYYDSLLNLLNMSHKSEIRQIYEKYQTYLPCIQYEEFIRVQQQIKRQKHYYNSIMDDSSDLYNKIKSGMIYKRGMDCNYNKKINQIRETAKEILQIQNKNIEQLKQALNKSKKYDKYIKLTKAMEPFFKMWQDVDGYMRNQNIQRGDTFEKKVRKYLRQFLLKKNGINQQKKYQIQTNCYWLPKNLGQIDIAILAYNQMEKKWEVSTLIQCKSRLYDIREAYKQVSELKDKGKEKLCTSLGILDLAPHLQYFIVTTLPLSPFNLRFQSKLKSTLDKARKKIEFNELNSKKLYTYAKEIFKNQLSPQEWFIQNDSDKIIVLGD